MIAVIHNLESGANFNTHLHNGDSLKGRTYHVPAGRPEFGHPPYTFEESAEDALDMKGLDKVQSWTDERIAYELERYNGFGHRLYHKTVLTPYLWSGTTHYSRGKYVEDGKWDGSAVSQQIGAIPLLQAIRKLDVANSQALAPVSAKLDIIKRIKVGIQTIASIVGGWFTLENFDFASAWFGRISGAAPLLLVILFLLGLGYIGFRYVESLIVQDYKDGRWIPSGEITDDDTEDTVLAAERAANRAGRDVDHEAARAEAGQATATGGVGEGAAVNPQLVSAGSQ
jgi:hypothetical protein